MTNQTQIFSASGTGAVNSVITNTNAFIRNGKALGYINFDIKPVVVNTLYASGGTATANNWYTVQINYYDPALA